MKSRSLLELFGLGLDYQNKKQETAKMPLANETEQISIKYERDLLRFIYEKTMKET